MTGKFIFLSISIWHKTLRIDFTGAYSNILMWGTEDTEHNSYIDDSVMTVSIYETMTRILILCAGVAKS